MKYENTFKAIDQILWKEQGCGSELDYLEQKSWMLFLKYLDDLETEREEEAELDGKTYKRLVSGFYRWSQWATPKKRDPQTGKMVLDTVNAMSGDDLVEFVDQKLFPYLKDFQNTATQTDSLEYKIGEIFGELHNKIRSGFNMREVINLIDELHFQSADDKHEMTVLYESNIQRMGNAGRNGGEYYKPTILAGKMVNGEFVANDPNDVDHRAVSTETSTTMRQMLATVREQSWNGGDDDPDGYIIGSKTGTGETLNDDGTYTSEKTVVGVAGFGANCASLAFSLSARSFFIMFPLNSKLIYV